MNPIKSTSRPNLYALVPNPNIKKKRIGPNFFMSLFHAPTSVLRNSFCPSAIFKELQNIKRELVITSAFFAASGSKKSHIKTKLPLIFKREHCL